MNYHSPTSFAEAAELAARAEGVTRILAGGTDVLVQMRSFRVRPDTLIDIKRIPAAQEITRNEDGSWTIGAAVPGARLAAHEQLCADWPGVVEAMHLVGSMQIQSRATLAGNLCNGSPAADSVPAMVSAGARARIIGPEGEREVAVEDIPTGPGKTSLKRGEIVAAILLPARGPGGGDAYLRFIPRTEMDIAVVGCGVNLRREGDRVTEARVALGAVGPTVVLAPQAAEAIIGTALDEAALEALAEAARAVCTPIDDKRGTARFRTHVAGVLAQRAARIAWERAARGGKE